MSSSGQVKSKSPWFLAVICRFLACICRFLAVICGSLSVSVGSWRLYVGSWWSSAVPGGYLVLGVLLSCSGQLKTKNKLICVQIDFLPKLFFSFLIVHAVLFGQTWTFMSQRFKILECLFIRKFLITSRLVTLDGTRIVLKHIGPEMPKVLFWAL